MSTTTQKLRQKETFEPVLHRAATDPVFRERLLCNPENAIEEELGIEVPSSFTIRFVEKADHVDAQFTVPDLISDDGISLSEDELQAVAGGSGQNERRWCCDCSDSNEEETIT